MTTAGISQSEEGDITGSFGDLKGKSGTLSQLIGGALFFTCHDKMTGTELVKKLFPGLFP